MLWGGVAVVEGSCFEVVEVAEVVGVVLGFGAGLEDCEGLLACDVVVVVEGLDSTGGDWTTDEGVFCRGMNRTS